MKCELKKKVYNIPVVEIPEKSITQEQKVQGAINQVRFEVSKMLEEERERLATDMEERL